MALAGFVHDELLDTNGKALKLATVEVRNTDGTLATLYSAATMGSTVANPTQADSRGNVSFWATNGEYDLIVTPQGGTAQPAYRVRTTVAPGALAAEHLSAAATGGLAAGTVGSQLAALAKRAVIARDYATSGDGSATSPWTGWEAGALAAVPIGGTIVFTPEYFTFSTWDITKPCTLAGSGWWNGAEGYFGNASYSKRSNYGGTVLVSTATTGNALQFELSNRQLFLRDFLLVGPGSGTSRGIKIGTATNYMKYAAWQNVQVMNFYQGYELHFCQDNRFTSLRSRGCRSGILGTDFTNQNVFEDTSIEYSGEAGVGGDGILFTATVGRGASLNIFYGGLLQNIVGRSAWRNEASCDNNMLKGFWMEGSDTATSPIDIVGGGGCAYEDARHSSNAGTINIAGAGFRLGPIGAGGPYTVNNSGNGSILVALGSAVTVNDTGTNTIRISAPDGLVLRAASGGAPFTAIGGAGGLAEASYYLAQSRARFGYDGAAAVIDDNGTNKPFRAKVGGNVVIEGSTVAADGETALLLRRNVGGTLSLQRVSMGAVDSGGTGFKVLRVPN
jgi:hypothetical protein